MEQLLAVAMSPQPPLPVLDESGKGSDSHTPVAQMAGMKSDTAT